MPNMNGFELTRNIKENPATEEIPVILVTALESQSDMKKGMDAGADAYIVKSSFEKSNLVETIKRFI
jgi:two-component system chemotaxis sensor kinase CheA